MASTHAPINPIAAYHIGRKIVGAEGNGEPENVPEPWRPLVDRLAALPPEQRQLGWLCFLAGRPDADALVAAVAAVDPTGPPPAYEADEPEQCATLADVRRLIADTAWPWPHWLAAAVLNALAADPGTGKTLMAFQLALVLWFGWKWPDGSDKPYPQKTRTLWVPGDRHYPQLLDLAAKHGLPEDALLLNAWKSDPTTGLDLDDETELTALAKRIETEKPGLVIVDTVGMTTAANLCKPEDARTYFSPLMAIAQETAVPFLLLTHLSLGNQALGRRIVGACRVVWKMSYPDPDGQRDRRRVWVDKTYDVKPPPMGMTIGESGLLFDFNPPTPPEPDKGGRPPEERDKAREFIFKALTEKNDRKATALCSEWTRTGGKEGTFWNARNDLVTDGKLTCDGRPKIMHLNPDASED
jgi:hypothetical protein